MNNNRDRVFSYHRRTKHHRQRYAAGPPALDWAHQPDPFRTFSGSPRLDLPLRTGEVARTYRDLYRTDATGSPLSLSSIAVLLELSFGISAWKQYEHLRWALRCNPSSGNLHPTEAYVITGGCIGIEDGVHHYVSRDHVLEHRCHFGGPPGVVPGLPEEAMLVGLSSIPWREAWKYGERAYRYCQHDIGHAIASIRYAAATLGWRVQILTSWTDDEIGAVLGTDRTADFPGAEHEWPEVMLLVTAAGALKALLPADALIAATRRGSWHGQANVLSAQHVYEWPVIDEVASACAKPRTCGPPWQPPTLPAPMDIGCVSAAVAVIKKRRSAQALDGARSLPAEVFYRMLDMTLPRVAVPPWDAITWKPRIHLALFVHRIDGFVPGLYLFVRNPEAMGLLRDQLSREFDWVRVAGCPAHIELYRLVAANTENAARTLSCHQDIAADGMFSVGMLAEYESSLAAGPWHYRELFWEAGVLGQVLYLEAEAAGFAGTGIGCYFDDAVHEVLGIQGDVLQSMYHFTVGQALTDTRLQTWPAYAHLAR
ncbi:MAG: nitroreductase family protein [Acidiferrobacteraceae bacterium]